MVQEEYQIRPPLKYEAHGSMAVNLGDSEGAKRPRSETPKSKIRS